MKTIDTPKTQHHVVSREQWMATHKAHLIEEKRITQLRDELANKRRELPWVKVDKHYSFNGPNGQESLAELFDGRSQLIVKHFMFGPGWKDGCVGCSFECDHIDSALVHLNHHDVSVVAVSRAPLAEFEPFHKRMGWKFKWVSSSENDFNFDYHVSFTPADKAAGKVFYNFAESDYQIDELSGFSFFYKNEAGEVFHTFSAYGRGAEELMGTYVLLDRTAKGRNETGPNFNLTDWVRHHDRYDDSGYVDNTGRFVATAAAGAACGCNGGPS